MVLGENIGVDGRGDRRSVAWSHRPKMNEVAVDDRLWRPTGLHQVADAKDDQSTSESKPEDVDGFMVSVSAEREQRQGKHPRR